MNDEEEISGAFAVDDIIDRKVRPRGAFVAPCVRC